MTNALRSALFAATLLAAAAPCLAQDAGGRPSFEIRPDRGFGRGGFVRTLRAGRLRLDSVDAARWDHEGRIVVAGRRRIHPLRDYAYVPLLARLLPDGRLDETFGEHGIASFALTGSPTGLVLDRQGRIVFCGRLAGGGRTYVAARCLPDGSLDAAFSGEGLAEGSSITDSFVLAVGASPEDDSVLVILQRSGGKNGVARFRADGSMDGLYGGDGFAEIPTVGYDVAVDSLGRAVVGCHSPVGLIRLAADGSLDAFDAAATMLDGHGGPQTITAFAVDREDRVAAYAGEIGGGVGLHRFLPDGTPDPAFGDAGVIATPSGAPGDANTQQFRFGAAARAERFVVAAPLVYLADDLRNVGGAGMLVQILDRAAPERVATYVTRDRAPRGRYAGTIPTAVLTSDDGRAAFVLGSVDRGPRRETPFVLRLDLADLTRREAPDLAVEWAGTPSVFSPGSGRFDASFRVTNRGRAESPGVRAVVAFSSDDALDASDVELIDARVPSLRRGASRTIALFDAPLDVTPPPGTRLIVALQTETADPAARVAVSAPVVEVP